MMTVQHNRPGPAAGVNAPTDAEIEALSAEIAEAWPERRPEALWQAPQLPVIDDEVDQLRTAVARALSPRDGRDADLRDLVFRLGRVEDALAGLRAGQGRIVNRMITFVCFAIGARPTELVSLRRSRHLAFGRFAIMWAATQLTNYSYPRIAEALGGFDHTTIIHGVRRAEQLRETDPDFRHLTDALIAHFRAELRARQTEETLPCLPL